MIIRKLFAISAILVMMPGCKDLLSKSTPTDNSQATVVEGTTNSTETNTVTVDLVDPVVTPTLAPTGSPLTNDGTSAAEPSSAEDKATNSKNTLESPGKTAD